MKRRLLPIALVVILVVSLLPIQALAAVPSRPGLYAEQFGWTRELTPDTDKWYQPENGLVPSDATYVKFWFWDHGEEASRGWTFNGTPRYRVNGGEYSPCVDDEGVEQNYNSGGMLRARLRYATVRVNQGFRSNMPNQTQTFHVTMQRPNSLNHIQNYAISFSLRLGNPPGPAPAVDYDFSGHRITGLDSRMWFSYTTNSTGDSWSDWLYYRSGTNLDYNMYPHLSTSRATTVRVQYMETSLMNPASQMWTKTIPRLEAAPSGLYIEWVGDLPVLWGLDESRYYHISKASDFEPTETYEIYDSPLVNLSQLGVSPGNTVYVRSATANDAKSPTSAAARVTVPAKQTAPNASYDYPTHTLYNLQSSMDFRIGLTGGWTSWVQVPVDNAYFNVYPYLSANNGATIETRYRTAPDLVQRMEISKLAPAPSGLYLEWVDGVGLVMWGLQNGNYYDFALDSYFDSWYATDGSYAGINIAALGLQPGNTLYVRSAPSTTSATSACVELIVPSMSAPANALDVIPEVEDAEIGVLEDEIITEETEDTGDRAISMDEDASTNAEDADIGMLEDESITEDTEIVKLDENVVPLSNTTDQQHTMSDISDQFTIANPNSIKKPNGQQVTIESAESLSLDADGDTVKRSPAQAGAESIDFADLQSLKPLLPLSVDDATIPTTFTETAELIVFNDYVINENEEVVAANE